MQDKKQLAESLVTISAQDGVPDVVKSEILDVANRLQSPIDTDVWIYRMVVGFLGCAVLVTVLGAITVRLVLRDANLDIPDGVIALGSAAIGALAGLLAPSPRG